MNFPQPRIRNELRGTTRSLCAEAVVGETVWEGSALVLVDPEACLFQEGFGGVAGAAEHEADPCRFGV